MSNWNEERAKHKAARRQPAPEGKLPAKRKKAPPRPFEVWCKPWRAARNYTFPEMKYGAFSTKEEALAYIEKQVRAVYWSGSYRHVSPGTPTEQSQTLEQRQAERRAEFFIKVKE